MYAKCVSLVSAFAAVEGGRRSVVQGVTSLWDLS